MVLRILSLTILLPASGHLCLDAQGGGVSFLQASKKLWAPPAPAPVPAASSSLPDENETQTNATNASNASNVTIDYTQAFNFSDMADFGGEEVQNETPSVPYSETNSTEEVIPLIKPIEDAKPLPELDVENLTEDLRDCLMGFWSEWSECSKGLHGLKGPHQLRQRSIIQPWLPGGAPCGAQSEARECDVEHHP
ncbi:unnamed protein product [Symbiodinium pilosum]|uniref:Uncharacterized protein n=1 Tax=Symbiodinium pilosum TaxID=2952 RepID=A0A812UC88_SYMPI|nr:unnamed protein product [Symbiodinium pilosum]